MASPKILITGSSGFIGSYMVEEALSRGFDVWAGIRSTSSKEYLKDPRIQFLVMDFEDEALVLDQLSLHKFDYVIHNAGLTKAKKEADLERVNVSYLKTLVKALEKNNLWPKKFIFMSSLAALGPGDEREGKVVRNDSVPNPVTAYGRSKRKAEQYLKQCPSALNFIGIRPTAVYGPREKELFSLFEMINKGIELHVGFSDQWLSFIYVQDLVSLIFDALESDESRKFYLVSDGQKYKAKTLNTLVRKGLGKRTIKLSLPVILIKGIAGISEFTSKFTGKYPPLNIDKVNELECRNWIVDISDIEKDFNFSPKTDLEEGIIKTAQWYLDHNWLK